MDNNKKKIETNKKYVNYKSVGVIKKDAVRENDLTYYITSYDMNELIEHKVELTNKDYFGFDMGLDFVYAATWSSIIGFFIFVLLFLFFYWIAAAYGRYFEDVLEYIVIPVFLTIVCTGFVFLNFYKKYRIIKKMKKVAKKERKNKGYFGEFQIVRENEWEEFMEKLVEREQNILKQ